MKTKGCAGKPVTKRYKLRLGIYKVSTTLDCREMTMWEARRRMLTGQLAPAKGWFIKSPKWPSGKYLFQENPASGQVRGQPVVWAQHKSSLKALA